MSETYESLSKEPNTACIICGRKYYVCDKCKELKTIKHWKSIADNTNCYKIFITIQQYLENKISKAEAGKLLENADLANMDEYADWVQIQIKNIKE